MSNKTVTVFGGSGFVGSQIIRELAAKGFMIKVATRVPERAYDLKPCGNVGQIIPIACNYNNDESIESALRDSDYVVNCIGILFERGKSSTFKKIHVDIPQKIAQACAENGVDRFVHISALGCDTGTSKYAKTKLAGEDAIKNAFPAATILRPSVIFGPKDNFFNMFASLSLYMPFLPLIGGGKTKFQPVFVGNVADAVLYALQEKKGESKGKTYHLGGPDIVDFKEIYQKLFKYTGRTKPLVNLPFAFAKFEALFLSMLPKPLLTSDQVESLKTDVIISQGALTFENMGIHPKSMDLILPLYLKMYRSGGRFSQKTA
ncbi:MAG: complex I NDUFA9 subunit family protein [Alphaproteobacteria bacterium]|nr:complex I NDUFA9 subunit family protein [Alphaproteobacteria bacterium]